MQEYYKILGIDSSASDEEVEQAYKTLKEKYSRERFYEGEIGNDAARKLTKVETAYHEIMEKRKVVKDDGEVKHDFSEVESLIKKGDISGAQALLDDVYDRNAEWHYLQSVIFYKKNWVNESKKQLEIAINMEPHNVKYADDYAKLKQKIEFNERQFKSGNAHYNQGAPNEDPNRQMGGSDMNNCMNFCATWCCIDMMCSLCCR